jgi:glutamate-1-semialdehyde 2,1-aminomutase
MDPRPRSADHALRVRAARVIPGGMYGHLSAASLPAEYPQFYARAAGSRVWDVDGNEYVDLMCGFGPTVLGYGHPGVEAAAAAQRERGDTQAGPTESMVELAELMVDRLPHADWAVFSKNGSDATTLCLTIARAATGRSGVLVAETAYHGSVGWCSPNPTGVPRTERALVQRYRYNDLESVERAVAAAGADDVAAVFVSPFRHDAGFDQELPDAVFAQGLRELCSRIGAALVIDEVRTGSRLTHGDSWERFGVRPDLSAWGKAIGNGHPIAATLGSRGFSPVVERIFVTGSYWFQAVPMAAAIATINALRDEDAVGTMERTGRRLRDGLDRQAREHGLAVRQTGPVQMPFLSFERDREFERAAVFCAATVDHGALLHPRHNWFVSAAHSDDDVDAVLDATDAGFRAVGERFPDA